jgi:20S proteasome alpha/beta subunit
MTVCIAALFNWNYAPVGQPPHFKKAAIAISDRMITAGDVQYEPQQTKVAFVTKDILILIAGDYSRHSEALANAYRNVQQSSKPQNVALIYGRAIQSIKQRQAEDLFLAPLGMNGDTFLAQQKDLADSFVERVTNQIQAYEGADVEAIVLGCDGENAQIYTVDTRGMISCLNDVGFAAIGIGAWHAKSGLMQAGYNNGLMLAPALAATFVAKKSAEVAPGVGDTTDIHILTKEGSFRPWPEVDKQVHHLYDDYQKGVAALAEEAVLELQNFIAQQSAEPVQQPAQNGGDVQATGGAKSALTDTPGEDKARNIKKQNPWQSYWPKVGGSPSR